MSQLFSPRKQAETRTEDGQTQINTGVGWVNYPPSASKLIEVALDHGWGVDDGLPPRFLHDGTAYIRVVLGREAGHNANAEQDSSAQILSPGFQYRICWYLQEMTLRFAAGPIVYRSTDFQGWKSCAYIAYVRRSIAEHPVKLPSVYAEANN